MASINIEQGEHQGDEQTSGGSHLVVSNNFITLAIIVCWQSGRVVGCWAFREGGGLCVAGRLGQRTPWQ